MKVKGVLTKARESHLQTKNNPSYRSKASGKNSNPTASLYEKQEQCAREVDALD
jgi:hypothetical protein